jgi:hypothetical protein
LVFFWINDFCKLHFTPITQRFALFLNEWLLWTAFYPYNPVFCALCEWLIAVNCFLSRYPRILGFFLNDWLLWTAFYPYNPVFCALFWIIDCCKLHFTPIIWHFLLYLNDWLLWTAFYPCNPVFWTFFEWTISVKWLLPR